MKKLTCFALFLACGCGTNRASAQDIYLPVEPRIAKLEKRVDSIEERLAKLEKPAPTVAMPAKAVTTTTGNGCVCPNCGTCVNCPAGAATAAPFTGTVRQTVMTSVCENGTCRLVPMEVDVPVSTAGNWGTQQPTTTYGPMTTTYGPMTTTFSEMPVSSDGGAWYLGKNLGFGRARGPRAAAGGGCASCK